MRKRSLIGLLGLLLALTACSSIPEGSERLAKARALAAEREWRPETLSAGSFELVVFLPRHPVSDGHLTIYIEGDGFAWRSRSQPSNDPTPIDPLALRLALAQPTGNAAYLARPCQFLPPSGTGCPERYWTESRYAPEVVEASNAAIDWIKEQFGAKRISLVGYSGGAAIAFLVASQRRDVERLIAVAGNLDTDAWTRHHRIQPLSGSLNPAVVAWSLQSVPQWLFVGEQDRVIPPDLAESFAVRFPPGKRPTISQEAGFDHYCCWAENWERLWREASATRGH